MALTSTIFKARLQIADMDRHYYADHALTIAQHPSETKQRMMLRILAFCIHANDTLALTKGLSTTDEPDLWEVGLDGQIEHWVDLGQPDEKRIRKACGRASRVTIYTYRERSTLEWWKQAENKLTRFTNLAVVGISDESLQQLEMLVQRTLKLQCSIQDGEIWLSDDDNSVHIQPRLMKTV